MKLTVRKKTRQLMKANLRQGKEWGKDFWHPSKSDLILASKRHGTRYRKQIR